MLFSDGDENSVAFGDKLEIELIPAATVDVHLTSRSVNHKRRKHAQNSIAIAIHELLVWINWRFPGIIGNRSKLH